MLSNRISQLAPPPRRVPLRVACSAMLGITGTLGAAFLIMGMAFTWGFVGDFRPVDELRLALSTATTQGTITNVAATNASENDVPVYRYEFTFSTPDGQTVAGQGYSTGRTWSAGDRVKVQYVEGTPTVARMEETRLSQFSPAALFVVIFPLIGAAFFATATIRGWRQVTLLRHGEIAAAQTLSERATNVRVNNVPVIEYSYEFEAQDGESYLGSSKSLPSQHIGDEAEEPVLYLEWNPNTSTLVDGLRLRHPLDVDDFGQWITHESAWPVVRYALIWVGIIAVVAYGLWRALGVL